MTDENLRTCLSRVKRAGHWEKVLVMSMILVRLVRIFVDQNRA